MVGFDGSTKSQVSAPVLNNADILWYLPQVPADVAAEVSKPVE